MLATDHNTISVHASPRQRANPLNALSHLACSLATKGDRAPTSSARLPKPNIYILLSLRQPRRMVGNSCALNAPATRGTGPDRMRCVLPHRCSLGLKFKRVAARRPSFRHVGKERESNAPVIEPLEPSLGRRIVRPQSGDYISPGKIVVSLRRTIPNDVVAPPFVR